MIIPSLRNSGLIIITVLLSFTTYATPKTIVQWKVNEFYFKANAKIENPLNVEFGAVFEHENGHTMNIPGFYNDKHSWIIRFSPPTPGKWSYRTYASLKALSGIKKSFTVVKNTDKYHGPLTISKENPRKFEYADGTPYFLMAFELDWLFALDWDNPKGIPKTKQMVDHVSDYGFNQIVMNVYAYDANWGERDKIAPEHNFAEPEVFPFKGTNKHPDYTSLNIDFFKHLDRVIAYLDQKGIITHLMIYVWNKKVNWPEPESEADNLYFDYIVKRYQAYPNIIWDISKEALAYGRDDMNYITNRIKRLRKLDGHQRLLSVHDYTYCDAFPGEVDFISIQEWRPNLYSEMAKVYEKHSNKPIFNIEHGGYEKTTYSIFDGAYQDASVCLDRNYQCIFAGAYATYYWQNSSWYTIITDPFGLPKDEQPSFSYYKNIAKLFETYNFNTLKPEQYVFTPYALTNKKDTYLFYLPAGLRIAHGDISNTALAGNKATISWFDPLTGNYTSGGTYDFKNTTWMEIKRHPELTAPFVILILTIKDVR